MKAIKKMFYKFTLSHPCSENENSDNFSKKNFRFSVELPGAGSKLCGV